MPSEKEKSTAIDKAESLKATVKEQKTKAMFRGYLRYLQRPGATIKDVWETERIGKEDEDPYIREVITYSGFFQRAVKGEWKKRRQEHWLEVRSNVMDHLQTEAVKSEIAEIEELEALKVATMATITGDAARGVEPVRAKSFEGSVNAYIALDKRISGKRNYVAEQTAASASRAKRDGPALSPSGLALDSMGVTVGGETLSDEELHAMAKALSVSQAGLDKTDNAPQPSTFTKDDREGDSSDKEGQADDPTVSEHADRDGEGIPESTGGEQKAITEACTAGDISQDRSEQA